MNVLKDKRTEAESAVAPVSLCCASENWRYRANHRVFMSGREVRINHEEYAMLYYMASVPGQVFSKVQFYAAAWGEDYLYGTNSVENIISRMRKSWRRILSILHTLNGGGSGV